MNNSNQLATPINQKLLEQIENLGFDIDNDNVWSGRFVVKTMSKEVLYGKLEHYGLFMNLLETNKFIQIGNKNIATHQIIEHYPEQITNFELRRAMSEAAIEKAKKAGLFDREVRIKKLKQNANLNNQI